MQTETNNARAFALAIKLARLASPTSGATDAERDSATTKLADHCAKHKLDLAAVIAAAGQPDAPKAKRAKPADAPKPEAKPQPEAAKPSKPHADDAKRADAHDEREKLVGELRTICAAIYNGPSLAVRSNPKRIALSVYDALHAAPKHRTTLDRVSVRDVSFLSTVVTRGGAGATFDPTLLNLDSGVFSRLSSVGFIERAPASAKLPYRLTKRAIEHLSLATKRAA